jgi:hypothetical protein
MNSLYIIYHCHNDNNNHMGATSHHNGLAIIIKLLAAIDGR